MAKTTKTPVGDDSPKFWKPEVTLDLTDAAPAAFRDIVAKFYEWALAQPKPDLGLADGWHEFTPALCEQALMRNAGNRQVSFSTVQYYARQMVDKDWQETGQPVLLNVHGDVADAQHRLWAGYLSGAGFTSYVVNQRKEIPNLFAYIDNAKARSIKDALYTAGLNGLSATLGQVVKLALQDEQGALTPAAVKKVEKLTPHAALVFIEARPNLRRGVRLMAGDHQRAAQVISHPDVASYMAALILTNHDEFVLDEFMQAMEVDDDTTGSSIAAFQLIVKHDKVAREPMKRHQVLGYLIKAFNAWHLGEEVKKLTLRVNEDFPQMVAATAHREAAE